MRGAGPQQCGASSSTDLATLLLGHATLAARSTELNRDSEGGADHDVFAPPPSAAEIGHGVENILASEIVHAPPGPMITPEVLASKLKVGSGEESTDKEEVSCSQKEGHST